MKRNGLGGMVGAGGNAWAAFSFVFLAAVVLAGAQPCWAQTTTKATGSLVITINPTAANSAGAQWRVDGGTYHNSGEKVTGLAVGWHTVSFKTVSGWTTPANFNKYIWGNYTNTASATYKAVSTGSLQVTLSPAGAVSAGAQWQVDGGTYRNSGETVTGLTAGSHAVSFKAVSGYTTPATQTVNITAGAVTSASGAYVLIPPTGSLQVTLSPAGAVSAGAQWQVDGGTYRNSGETVTGLATGSHTVTFKTVSGYTTPATQTVNITTGAVTSVSGAYVLIPPTGSLQVTLSPAGAVSAGAQWQVDGGTYRNSGETVTGLTAGSHAVTFKAVSGYTTPASLTVTVLADALALGTGTYIPLTGSLQVTLSPAGAVTAGAQWQVDGGAYYATGATATGLAAGVHTVAFKTVPGWITPNSQSVTVAAGQATSASGAYVAVPNTSHYGRFTTYEGSKTCRTCHPQETADVHGSLHYQWKGSTPYVDNMTVGGKLGAINDFCTYADISWISQLTNLAGAKVDGGCAQCHVGLGQKPLAEATDAQLNNIDCLVCHSEKYKRKVSLVGSSLAFVPAPEKMSVSLIEGITDITLPTRGACLNCHAYAGGGNNNKRGDLEEAHRNPTSASFDVHMAPQSAGGAGLQCTDCHAVQNHHIAGRGVDLRATDLDVEVSCEKCHTTAPHDSSRLNSHTKRVDCTVCHIPHFAKGNSTDMVRDYSQAAVLDPVKQLYEPHIDREANVVPEYWFFNGMSYIYEFLTPAVPNTFGYVTMAAPLGAVTDTGAKIEAFKHHRGVQAYDLDTQALLPVKAGILFQTGDVDRAIRQGAADVGLPLAKGYGFVDTERYMGLFHEVAPSSEALQCNACHNGGTRMDFDALGYTPKTTRNGKKLCASCHGDESGEWSASELFNKVHEKHVTDKKINCIECHIFAK